MAFDIAIIGSLDMLMKSASAVEYTWKWQAYVGNPANEQDICADRNIAHRVSLGTPRNFGSNVILSPLVLSYFALKGNS
jgi:hypothetical protein